MTTAEVQISSAASEHVKYLIYGASGVGKSRLAASAEKVKEMAPCLVFSFDNSLQSVEWPVHQVQVPDWPTFVKTMKLLKGQKQYKTVIFDTLTEFYRVLLDEAMRQAKADAAARNRPHDQDLPEQRDYYRAHENFRKYMREFRDAPVHFIATAQRAYAVDQVSNEMLGVSPMISGRLNYEVCAYFWLISFLEATKGGGVGAHFEPMRGVETKDRLHKIPDILDDPTMDEIYGYLFPKKRKGGK